MITLRKAYASDEQAIAQIGYYAWRSAVLQWQTNVALHNEAAEMTFVHFAKRHWVTAVIALKDDIPIGFAACEKMDNVITDIWVLPDYQRLGAGGLLLKYIEDEIVARGDEVAVLETHSDNANAINFFKHHNYRVSSLTSSYSAMIKRDIPLVGMTRDLDMSSIEDYSRSR